jgi:hypothetical protein
MRDLSRGLQNLEERIGREEQSSKQLHKANLFPLINCVDALALLQTKIQHEKKVQKEEGKEWPLTISKFSKKILITRKFKVWLKNWIWPRKRRINCSEMC